MLTYLYAHSLLVFKLISASIFHYCQHPHLLPYKRYKEKVQNLCSIIGHTPAAAAALCVTDRGRRLAYITAHHRHRL